MEQTKQRFQVCKNVMSIQTPQAGPLRIQIASRRASRLGKFLKAGHQVQSFICQMRTARARGERTSDLPKAQQPESLVPRPTGGCYIFFHCFPLSKMLLKSFHKQTVCVFRAKTDWSKFVKFLLSGGPCSNVPPLFYRENYISRLKGKGWRRKGFLEHLLCARVFPCLTPL